MDLALELVLRTSLLALAAAGLARVMARTSAASRHLLWTGFLAAAIVLPLARIALPPWPLAILAPQTLAPAAGLPSLTPAATARPTLQRAPDASGPASIPVADRATSPRPAGPAARAGVTVIDVVIAVWAIVCAGFVCRMLMGLARARRLRVRSMVVTESGVLARVELARRQFHVRRSITALTSPDELMPMTWGVVRPAILLPSSMSTLAGSHALGSVIAHEVAHIARLDAIALFVERLAVALHWFNPLVWFAARRAQLERERACDDAVLASGAVASDYATHLLMFVRSRLGLTGSSGALSMARGSQLEARVQSILDGRAIRGGCSRASVWVAVALMAAMLPIAVVRVTARTAPPTAQAPITLQSPAANQPSATTPGNTTATAGPPQVVRQGSAPGLPKTLEQQLTNDVNTPLGSRAQDPSTAPAPPQVGQTTGSCTTPDPFVSLGGGRCMNGGWLPPGAPAAYVIGPDDLLTVIVARAPEVSGDVRVKPDGTIRLSIGNDIRAGGQTAWQVEANIRAELSRFYVQPDVFVQVKGIRSRAFFFFNDTLPPGQTLQSMMAAARVDEWNFMVKTLRDRAAKTEHDIATKVEIGTVAGIDQSEFRGVPQALNALTAWSHPPTDAQAAALRSRFTDAVRNLDTVQIRFDNGLATIRQIADAYLAAADGLKEPPPGQLTMPSPLSDADLIVALKTAAILYPDAARADKLVDLAQRHAFTPEMVALYVAAANGIASDTERARVFAQTIRVKGK